MVDRTFIYCTFDIEGFHRWPDAEGEIHLKNRHRHLFMFKLQIEVFKDDRQLEFIQIKREMIKYIRYLYGEPAEFNDLSCEEIAKRIKNKLLNLLGMERIMIITISEDRENGAEVTYIPDEKKHGEK